MIGVNAEEHTTMPTVLEGGPLHLCLFHMGMMVGFTSNIALISETETVVAILANASQFGDDIDLMSQMVMEAIFEPPVRHNYEQLVEEVAVKVLGHIPSLGKELDSKRLSGTHHSFPLEAHAESFTHDQTPFKIDVRLGSDERSLMLTFMAQEADTYELRYYHNDVFTMVSSPDLVCLTANSSLPPSSLLRKTLGCCADYEACRWVSFDEATRRGRFLAF